MTEKTELVEAQHPAPDDASHPGTSPPTEDSTAWLQVLGAFCLNLTHGKLLRAGGDVFPCFFVFSLANRMPPPRPGLAVLRGLMNAYGAFQTFYELDLLGAQSSPSSISWIGSVQAGLMFLLSLAVGPVFDAGHLKVLLWLGTLLAVLGMFLTSIGHVYWQIFLSQGVMMGLGFGFLYLPAPAIVSQYFQRRMALAMGIASAGSAVGMGPPPPPYHRIKLGGGMLKLTE